MSKTNQIDTVDPVCGMVIPIHSSRHNVKYQNDIFFFCSNSCRRLFRRNPGNYIKGVADSKLNPGRSLGEEKEFPTHASEPARGDSLTSIRLPVFGIRCLNCARIIENTLRTMDGISQAYINYSYEEAHLTFDPLKTSIEEMNNLLKDSGYRIGEREAPYIS